MALRAAFIIYNFLPVAGAGAARWTRTTHDDDDDDPRPTRGEGREKGDRRWEFDKR
jgi:hypothetical protein